MPPPLPPPQQYYAAPSAPPLDVYSAVGTATVAAFQSMQECGLHPQPPQPWLYPHAAQPQQPHHPQLHQYVQQQLRQEQQPLQHQQDDFDLMAAQHLGWMDEFDNGDSTGVDAVL